MAVAVDMCGVMRREGKGMGQMTDPQCMVHTASIFATGTDTAVVCQTKYRHRVANFCHRNNAIWGWGLRRNNKFTSPDLYNSCFAEYCIRIKFLSNADDKFLAFLRLTGTVYKPADEETSKVVPPVLQVTAQEPALACQSVA